MKFNVLAADDFVDSELIDKALTLASANDILIVNYTKPKPYEKITATISTKHGITVMKKDSPGKLIDNTLIIYEDGTYEMYKHKFIK